MQTLLAGKSIGAERSKETHQPSMSYEAHAYMAKDTAIKNHLRMAKEEPQNPAIEPLRVPNSSALSALRKGRMSSNSQKTPKNEWF